MENSVQKSTEVLQQSGIILTPTDTTFGLSCLALDAEACQKLNTLKKRPGSKNFVLLVDSDAMLQRYVNVPDMAWDIMDLSDKPVTMVYDNIIDLPGHLISEEGTVAIRVVKMPLLQRVIQKVKQPLVSTSANLSGEKQAEKYDEIADEIKQKVDYIMPECYDFHPEFEASSVIQLSHDGQIKIHRA